jgi:hypothetical protein
LEFLPAQVLVDGEGLLRQADEVLRSGRVTFYENHIVRTAIMRKSDDKKKSTYVERLSQQHAVFTSYTGEGGKLYDASMAVHPLLWAAAKEYMGM